MGVIDECDTSYVVKTDISDNAKFYERGKSRPNNTWGLTVVQKLVMTARTVRVLRGKGFISRWEAFVALSRLKGNKTIFSTDAYFGALASVPIMLMLASLTSALLSLTALASLFTPALWLFVLALILLFLLWLFFYKDPHSTDRFFKKVCDKLEDNKERRIELPWEEEALYDFAKSLSKKADQEALKKTLFELLSAYPTEANTRINELFKMKEGISENSAESAVILSDIDGMLDKLFDMRDTPETTKIAEQVKQTLRDGVNKEKMEKAGVSVEKLSEIANFVNKSAKDDNASKPGKNEPEVSEMVNELNNVEVEYETAGKDNPGQKQITWHDA